MFFLILFLSSFLSLPEVLNLLTIGSILLVSEKYIALTCEVQCLVCEVQLTNSEKGLCYTGVLAVARLLFNLSISLQSKNRKCYMHQTITNFMRILFVKEIISVKYLTITHSLVFYVGFISSSS